MINLCSHFDINYLDKAVALYRSLAQHAPREGFHLYAVALDEPTWKFLAHQNPPLPNLTTIRLEQIETDTLRKIKRIRTHQEYCWTLTPSVVYYVLCQHQPDELAYIDADTFFFSSPRPLYNEVRSANAEIAIIPHRFAPEHQNKNANGKYNVALVYFRNTPIARKCLERWRDQCNAWCYARAEGDRFGDQKYLDDWQKFYGAYEVKHLGANLAPWNQLQYEYEYDDGLYIIDAARLDVGYGAINRIDPLLFYHFHEFTMNERGEVRRTNWQLHADVARYVYPPYEQAIRAARQQIAERMQNAKKS